MATEKTETPESQAQGSTVSVVFDPNRPDYVPDIEPADRPEKGDPDYDLYLVVSGEGGIKAALYSWNDWRASNAKNPHLSDLGRQHAEKTELPTFEAKLKIPEQIVERTAKALEKDRAALLPNLGPAKTAAEEVRHEGLRRWFSEQPKDKQPAILRQAHDSDNRELLSALVNANDAMGLIHPKVKAALLAAMIERDHPEAVAKLAVRERRVAAAKAALQRVRELMRGSVPTTLRERLTAGNK